MLNNLSTQQFTWLLDHASTLNEKLGSTDNDTANFVANQMLSQWSVSGLMTLGAHNFGGFKEGLGGLTFQANILPFKDGGRTTTPEKMLVVTELTVMDTYNVYVVAKDGSIHFSRKDLYADDLMPLAMSLDYDGNDVLNPRYMMGS